MPSPMGHALGAVGAGWLAGRPAPDLRRLRTQVLILTAIGIAPDLDLLIGRHSMETHSVGAAVLVGALAAWLRWPLAASRWGTFAVAGLAWLSHPVLDTLARDTTAPLGVMFLWPFSTGHFQTGWEVFAPISRRYWLDGFVSYTALAVAREVAIVLPLAGLAYWGRSRRNGRRIE